MELIRAFAQTWLSLDAYDKSALPIDGVNKKSVAVTSDELMGAIILMKQDLMAKKQATDLFASLRSPDGLESIIGNVFQSFGGEDVYPTLEEKAAHLLYFVVKNHIFTDGNKRSGAFTFVWYLQKCGLLKRAEMSPTALTSLTLLIAESNPKNKDQIVGLVLLLLGAK